MAECSLQQQEQIGPYEMMAAIASKAGEICLGGSSMLQNLLSCRAPE